MKSGFIAILGRPNVGKSTILNGLLDHKVSIVTPKSQTTRNSIRGIYNDEDSQIIFIDTPGIHKPHQKLGEVMNKSALSAGSDAEGIILVVDASHSYGTGDDFLANNLKINVPLLIVFNKIDLTNIKLITSLRKTYLEKYPNGKQIEVSAIEGFNLEEIIKELKKILPEGPKYYDDDKVTDAPDSFLISEVIREKILKLLKEEVPHSIAVSVENIEEKKNAVLIRAVINVEQDSQKGIVIGKDGKMIKRIGKMAREDLEDMYNKSVYLELFVKVAEDWRDKNDKLKEFGYNNK